MKIPTKLYKYESFSTRSLENLKNQGIYFASPKNFNDPFDCSIDANFKTISKSKLTKLHAEFRSECSNKTEFDIVYGIYPNKAFIQLLENSLIKFFNEMKDSMLNTKGISCFSETKNDILMWSHYSDCHKGFCLEFDTKFEPFNQAKPVKYSKSFPTLDTPSLFLKEDPEQVLEIFLTKHSSWNHEKEWRILHNQVGTLYTYPTESLIGLYFGAEIPYTYMEIISLIIQGQNPNVSFYKAEKSSSSFSVNFKEVTYTPFIKAKKKKA
ncbi:DUF2971 domain-containing protein [Desulfopila inferna]|uniref:DUF2971 domain-containing protein n=1 Tax=Desulfopila inferna TaxID=468528 RepID=UPI00196461A1|nr:DUF2971 domain-containing protein [Desulfopila inferna]MBM9605931.1 DUF2971 domain-containing protein [Desulfopila inferna]